MLRHLFISALAAMTLATAAVAWAQSSPPQSPTNQAAKDDDILAQQMSQKIRDQLSAQGFKDIKVLPASFFVSGKDGSGKAVMLVIGPNSTTLLTPTDPGGLSEEQNPNQGGTFQRE